MNEQIKVVTYNIDGLPDKLNLSDLPKILHFIPFIYKKIKGTTTIQINDNINKENNIEEIGKLFLKYNADLIGVQEDFNYHDVLMNELDGQYFCGKHLGGFDLSKIFSNTTLFPPRFKCDGINLLMKSNRVSYSDEQIVFWKQSYGYFTHANDKLTHKGFRLYKVNVGENLVSVDVYILHMDADFYHPINCPDISKDLEARQNQLKQLTDFIISRHKLGINRPIIIMGDTNSYNKYEWDYDNLLNHLINPINGTKDLVIKECVPDNFEDCDRIFYINNQNAPQQLECTKCYFDTEIKLSDHKPLIAEFNISY